MESLTQDIRFTLRMLIKSPGFTATALLSLVLAIGANTTMFSFVNAILLRSLPYKEPEKITLLWETFRQEGVERRTISYPDFTDWKDQNQSFEQMAAYAPVNLTLTGDDPERINAELANWNYFQTLGVEAAEGRTYSAEEDSTPDAHPVALVSRKFSKRKFGNDSALGKILKLNDKDFTIIGVMPNGFEGLTNDTEVWIPIAMISTVRAPRTLENRRTRWHQAVARLKPGVTIQQAQTDLDTIASRLEQAYPDSNKDRGALVAGVHAELFGNMGTVLWVLLGAVGFVLLIACANLANLLLARATTRQKELAVRTALGATRKRLMQQLLTESIILSLIGGLLGLVVAAWSLRFLATFVPRTIPSFVSLNVDFKVFGFNLVVSILTGIVFGLIPAFIVSSPSLNEFLKEGSRGSTSGGRRRTSNLLVVSEVALALVLLIGAGLMMLSLQRLQKVDTGFNPDNVLNVRFTLPERKYPNPQIASFSQRLIEGTEGLPSIQSASIASDTPLLQEYSATSLLIEGQDPASQESGVRVFRHRVAPKFFSTLQIPLLKGRDFTDQDDARAPAVAVISDAMAKKYWPGDDPITKRFKLGTSNDDPWVSIIGVVGEVRYRQLVGDTTGDPDVYFPLAQFPTRSLTLVARGNIDPASLTSAIRQEVKKIDPELPLFEIMTMNQRLANETAQARFNALLLASFAVLALVLAGVGVYGVMSYTAGQRTHEVGIRMALGAQKGDIIRLLMVQGLMMTAFGLMVGLVAAFSMTSILESFLYGVATTDPLIFGVGALLIAGTALAAVYVPAHKALKLDPATVLREG